MQVKVLLDLLVFQVSLSFFDMLLVTGGGFGTQFVPLPLCDPFLIFCASSLDLGPFSLYFLSPFSGWFV